MASYKISRSKAEVGIDESEVARIAKVAGRPRSEVERLAGLRCCARIGPIGAWTGCPEGEARGVRSRAQRSFGAV
jgi:hypothetical protein